ncbi:hypothetical protein RI367_006394 [Sorochytrium milnesiophthora]
MWAILAHLASSILLCFKVDKGAGMSYLTAISPSVTFLVVSTVINCSCATGLADCATWIMAGLAADNRVGAGWLAVPLLVWLIGRVTMPSEEERGEMRGLRAMDACVLLQAGFILLKVGIRIERMHWAVVFVPFYLAVLWVCFRICYCGSGSFPAARTLVIFLGFVLSPLGSLAMVIFKLERRPRNLPLTTCLIPAWVEVGVVGACLLFCGGPTLVRYLERISQVRLDTFRRPPDDMELQPGEYQTLTLPNPVALTAPAPAITTGAPIH